MEEYYTKRYLGHISRFYLKRNIQLRDHLVYTNRAILILSLSWAIFLISPILCIFILSNFLDVVIVSVISFLISFLLIPIWVAVANLLLLPFQFIAKRALYRSAKMKMKNFKDKKVVAIAGSYGKTTTKNLIYQLAHYNYKIQVTTGNVNTLTGISRWILNELKDDTEIIIFEVEDNDIDKYKKIAQLIKPNISVITSIGDQHQDRMGGEKQLVLGLFQIFEHADKDASLIFNDDDESTIERYIPDFKDRLPENAELMPIPTEIEAVEIPTELELPVAVKDNLNLALVVCEIFGITKEFIEDELTKIKTPGRRMNEIKIGKFKVIDNSYNISLKTATASLKYAKRIAGGEKKDLIVITGGIAELVKGQKDHNTKLGKIVAKSCNKVIVLKTIFAHDIVQGLLSEGFKEDNIFLANRMSEALEIIAESFDPEKALILMEPELTDLYY